MSISSIFAQKKSTTDQKVFLVSKVDDLTVSDTLNSHQKIDKIEIPVKSNLFESAKFLRTNRDAPSIPADSDGMENQKQWIPPSSVKPVSQVNRSGYTSNDQPFGNNQSNGGGYQQRYSRVEDNRPPWAKKQGLGLQIVCTCQYLGKDGKPVVNQFDPRNIELSLAVSLLHIHRYCGQGGKWSEAILDYEIKKDDPVVFAVSLYKGEVPDAYIGFSNLGDGINGYLKYQVVRYTDSSGESFGMDNLNDKMLNNMIIVQHERAKIESERRAQFKLVEDTKLAKQVEKLKTAKRAKPVKKKSAGMAAR